MAAINRLEIVLVEKQRKSKWLAEQLGKSKKTISKWCPNKIQPSLDMLVKIAKLLNVDIHDLNSSTNTKK